MQIHSVLLTQLKYFYIWKKLLLTQYRAHANMLIIILLCSGYFFKIDFLYYHIKIIHKHQKILIWIKMGLAGESDPMLAGPTAKPYPTTFYLLKQRKNNVPGCCSVVYSVVHSTCIVFFPRLLKYSIIYFLKFIFYIITSK